MKTQRGDEYIVLFKLGAREHMEEFRAGRLYLNTLAFFRELEGDPARADRLEGVDRMFQPSALKMTLTAPGFGTIVVGEGDLAGPVLLKSHQTSACNLLCLYSIDVPTSELFTPEHGDFGDSVVLILNTYEFLRRVLDSAKALGFETQWGPIEYFDPLTFTGNVGRFRKSSGHSHQKEFRIAVETQGLEPLRLDVGSLTDITSEVIPFAEANERLRFSESDALEAGLTW